MGSIKFQLSTTMVMLLCMIACICTSIVHCHPCDAYEKSDTDVIARCDSLIKDLEAVLLTENNLYILRDTFVSSRHNAPTVLIVEYNLTYNGSDLKLDIEHLPDLTYGWTSSSVYAVVDPISIFALETGIFAATYNFEDIFLPHIKLVLNITDTPIQTTDYSEDDLSFALKEITTRLKFYAEQQQEMKSWDGKHKGYTWKLKRNSVIVNAEFFLLVFIFAASFKVGMCFIKRLQDKQPVQIFPALFWALAVISFFWNVIDFLFNLIFLYLLFQAATNGDERYYAFSKLTVLCLVFLFALAWVLLGCVLTQSFVQPPKCVCPFCCTCCCTRAGKTRYLYCCAFLNISLFFFLVMANVVPVIILVFLDPVVILSNIALLSTIVISLVIWTLVPFASQKLKAGSPIPNMKQRRRYAEFLYYLVLLGLFIGFVFFLVVLYLQILIKGAETGDYFKVLFSFAPSVLLAGIGYFVKKKFLKQKNGRRLGENETPSNDEHTEQTDISLAELEEGRGTSRANEASDNENGVEGGGLDETRTNKDSQGPNSED